MSQTTKSEDISRVDFFIRRLKQTIKEMVNIPELDVEIEAEYGTHTKYKIFYKTSKKTFSPHVVVLGVKEDYWFNTIQISNIEDAQKELFKKDLRLIANNVWESRLI